MKSNILILMDMPLFPYRIYAYNLLAERGYNLTIVSASTQDLTYPIKMKFTHIRLGVCKLGPFIKLKGYNSLKMDDYDYIIVTPNLRCLSFYHLLFGNKYDSKLFAWGHLKGCTTGNKFAAFLRKKLCQKLQGIIFYENGTKKEFIANGYSPNKLFVANNTQYVNPDTIHFGLSKDYFLYVGRIQKRKGLELAIEAYAQLLSKYPDCHLLFKIVGSGDSSHLKRLCKKFNVIDYVDFVGPIHEEEKLGVIFSHAIAYVSPGHVGLGVLHSFAFGVPVITCSGRLHSVEIANCTPENSFIVPYKANDVSQAMFKLASDSTLQSQMATSAINYYNENCTISKMVDGIDKALQSVINS